MLKKYIVLSLGILFFLASCDEVVYDPIVTVGSPITLSSSADGSTVEITDSTLSDVVATFAWTAADYGFQAAITYALEVDTVGGNFGDPVSLASSNDLSFDGLTQERINNIAKTKGLPAGEMAAFEFRAVASVNDDVQAIESNVITINVIPFEAPVNTVPTLNVPGSYQGWDPADNSTAIFSREELEVYEGYLYFGEDNAEFKYAKGGWDMNWGDIGANGVLDPDGDNIVAGVAGMYFLSCDLNTLTHSYEKRDWGIIGTATPNNWDSDIDMTWDAAKGAMTITMDMIGGMEYKFRANDDWAVNFGDNDADGSLEQDGANIVVPEDGNYTIDLILNLPEGYTYSAKKN